MSLLYQDAFKRLHEAILKVPNTGVAAGFSQRFQSEKKGTRAKAHGYNSFR